MIGFKKYSIYTNNIVDKEFMLREKIIKILQKNAVTALGLNFN
jgi:hypothetical protein